MVTLTVTLTRTPFCTGELKTLQTQIILKNSKATKKHQEKIKLNFKSSNNEEYNNPFNLDDIKDAINKSHDTATGPDEIHYQMLKHLPPESLKTLLGIFNDIWETGKFPESWELATIIPIPKRGKDHVEPTNYRPIALTSCICKTLERMINTRLVWYLEFNNLISPVHSGFHSERSTNDNLVRLETFIRDAFVKKEHVVAVFFDLEKAHDTTWKYGILRDLHEFGVKGRLVNFVESFLANRSIQLRVGSTLSDTFGLSQGVPQGSILSTTLFNIKINSIMNCLDPKTDGSLYVDDFCMCYRSTSMRTIERHLQQCINRIEDWALKNGFKFSKSKTQCVHFCLLRKIHDDPELYLYGSLIPVVDDFKFLGLIFDRKLSFIPHIKYLKAKCLIKFIESSISKNSQIQLLLLKHHEISSSKTVIYCWIPSHIGIYGNEKVDKNAKESLNLEVTDFKIPSNNFKPFINKYVCDEWQTLWNERKKLNR